MTEDPLDQGAVTAEGAATAEEFSGSDPLPPEAGSPASEPLPPAETAQDAAIRAALASVEGQDEPTEADFAAPEPGVHTRRERWQRRTATGAILSGLAMGFQQVFEEPKKEASIVMETSGTPPRDLAVEAEFDGMAPRRSVVRIRPWLLDERPAEEPETLAATPEEHEGGA
jgi:hypothetical protein